MKIGIIYLKRRGSGGPISFQLATHLKKRVDVFAVVSSDAENISVWRGGGVPIIEMPTFITPVEAVRSFFDFRLQRRLTEQIKSQKPDVLFFPMLHWWTPMIQRRLRGIPNVVTIHDPTPHPGIVGFLESYFERSCLPAATRCVVLSDYFIPSVQAMGFPSEKIDVIPHGELSSYYSSHSAPPAHAGSAEPTILFFGRIAPYKGLEILLQAFEQIERASNARLLVVGAGNLEPYQQQLEKLTRVQVVNQWTLDCEVASYFRQAQIVVAPYTVATQSGIIAIAASMGIPVIATRSGGIREQIQDDKTGILVEPGSVNELTDACLRLINDRALAERLGKTAREVFQDKFGWARIADQVIASCKRAIDSP